MSNLGPIVAEVQQEIVDLVEELNAIETMLDFDDYLSAVDELECQSGTISTLVTKLKSLMK